MTLVAQSPIAVSNMKAAPRSDDPVLVKERALDCETSDDDLIVDLFFDLDWRSDFCIKLKLFGLLPISIEDVTLQAPMRTTVQWNALDFNDFLQFPNISYLAVECLGRADLTLSFKLFGIFDLFSIPPFSSLLNQDYLLDVLFDVLGPGTGFWLDFLRGTAAPYVILDWIQKQREVTRKMRKVAGEVESVQEAGAGSKTELSVTVLSSKDHKPGTASALLRFGKQREVSAAQATSIEKEVKMGKQGKLDDWGAAPCRWFGTASTDIREEDWL